MSGRADGRAMPDSDLGIFQRLGVSIARSGNLTSVRRGAQRLGTVRRIPGGKHGTRHYAYAPSPSGEMDPLGIYSSRREALVAIIEHHEKEQSYGNQ